MGFNLVGRVKTNKGSTWQIVCKPARVEPKGSENQRGADLAGLVFALGRRRKAGEGSTRYIFYRCTILYIIAPFMLRERVHTPDRLFFCKMISSLTGLYH
jgi:hypothetical protein